MENNNYQAICSLCNKFGFKPYLGVLTGWDWAIKYQDVKPPLQAELIRGNARTTVNVKDVKTMNEVIKVYRS